MKTSFFYVSVCQIGCRYISYGEERQYAHLNFLFWRRRYCLELHRLEIFHRHVGRDPAKYTG